MMRIKDHPSNCVPVALHLVSGLPEERVLATCLAHGFNQPGVRRGMNQTDWLRAARELGLELTGAFDREGGATSYPVNYYHNELTLAQFAREHRDGVYLVRVPGHLLVVNHGVVVDPNWSRRAGRRRVRNAWLVENAALVAPKRGRAVGRDPLLRVINYGAHRRGRHAQVWFRIKMQFERGTFRFSEAVPLGYIRRDLLVDLREGNVEVVDE